MKKAAVKDDEIVVCRINGGTLELIELIPFEIFGKFGRFTSLQKLGVMPQLNGTVGATACGDSIADEDDNCEVAATLV